MSASAGNANRERLKRLAAQLLSQLPEETEDALMVLAIARALVEWGVDETLPAQILRIVG